jgi:hypothetical protein
MNQFKIIDKNTNRVIATDSGTALEIVKKYKLAYESQQHLQLVQTS